MVWLYLPESEDLTSELTSLFHHQEPCVSSRGKPMLPQSLERKWKKGGFIRLLSGLMLPPSTANLLLEKWITSRLDSHASPGVLQGSKREPMTKDGFGTILGESFARFDHVSSSWKTSQESLMGDLTPFLGTWPKSGSMLNGVCSKRPKLVQTITVADFSYSPIVPKEVVTFPTPTASQIATEGTTRLYRNLYLNKTLTLEEATIMNFNYNPLNQKGNLKIYPTPTAQEAQKAGKYAKGQMGQSLSAMAKRGQLFNTPTTRDGANSTLPPSHANWDSLTGDMIRLGEARPGGVLNPQWVEWLMGWPIGWTDLERVEMELSHYRQGSHIPSLSKEPSKGGI